MKWQLALTPFLRQIKIRFHRIYSLLIVVLISLFVLPGSVFAQYDLPVTIEVHYKMANAGEVALGWGVNGFQPLPVEQRPVGTTLGENGVMLTPMVKNGDDFVAKVNVPALTVVHYGFLISKTSDGEVIQPIWDGSDNYWLAAPPDGKILSVESKITLPKPGPMTVTQTVQYKMTEAGDVSLVWGINGWSPVAVEIRPAGTQIKNNLMMTPMVRDGNDYSAKITIPTGASVDYGFLITKTSDGKEIKPVWDGSDHYKFTADKDGITQVNAEGNVAQALEPEKALPTFLEIFLPLFIGLGVIILFIVIFYWVPRSYRNKVLVGILVGVMILGLLMRLKAANIWNSYQPDSSERLIGDEPDYDHMARGLVDGKGITWPGRVPLYPVWLAGIYRLTGGSYNAVPYAQSVLSISTILLTFLLGRKLFGDIAGIIAAFWAAASYVLIQQPLHLLSEVLYTPVLLFVVITLLIAVQKPSAKSFILAGICVGISNLIRPTLFLFPLFLMIVLALVFRKRWTIKYGLVYLGVSLIVVAPWIIYNFVQYHAFIPLQTSNAILWQGSPEYYHLLHDKGYSYTQIWSEILYGPGWQAHDPNSIEGDRYWTRRALSSIAGEPLVYLKFALEKVFTFWVGDPSADWGGLHVFSYQGLRKVGFLPGDAFQVMIARTLPILALIAAISLHRKARLLLPVYAVFAYFTILHALTHAEARLSEPLEPFMLALIAGAVVAYFVQIIAPQFVRTQVINVEVELRESL